MSNNAKKYNFTAFQIQQYLINNNWEQDTAFKNKKLMVFTNKTSGQRIAIPADEKYNDFEITVSNVIDTIAYSMDKKPDDVLNEICNYSIDKIEFRVISDIVSNGTMPLEYASNIVEGTRNLILYSACAEEKAQPICCNVSNKSKSYLDKFQFAQTKVGSFIFNIEADISDNEQLSLADTGNISTHNIVKRISCALQQLSDIVENNINITEIYEKCFEKGITYNMCNALMALKPPGNVETTIETTIKYSSRFDDKQPDKIFINNNYFPIINEFIEIYSKKEVSEFQTLEGRIYTITHNKKVEFSTTLYDKKAKIELKLNEDAFSLACDAIKKNSLIQISGDLIITSKGKYKLKNISKFEILSE